jgi:UDP-N-acetylmuramoylalanine--D-glutamate ligase
MARAGGCVLLSPASASFDAFPNFAVRGNTFRSIVESFEAASDKN